MRTNCGQSEIKHVLAPKLLIIVVIIIIIIIIISITKFLIEIGSPCAYLSRNRRAVTWMSDYRRPI